MTDVQAEEGPFEGRAEGLLEGLRGVLFWEVEAAAVRLSFLSESASELLGAPGQRWEADAGLLKKHVHSEDWGGFLETLYQAAAEGGVRTYEHRMLRLDGSVLWVQTLVQRSSRSNGALLLTGLTVDISPIKQRELSLREAEAHSRLLIENIRDYGVFMLTLDGHVASWTPGAQRLKGFRAEEVLGVPLSFFFPAGEVEKGTPGRLLARAELERQAEYEGWLLCKGGKTFWASLTLSAVTDEKGRLRGYSNVARDLTQRKRTEDAMRESEERLRLLIDSVQDYGVFMLAPNGTIASWNPGAQRMKQYTAEEIIGAPFAWLFPPEQVKAGDPGQLIQRAAAEGRAEYEGWLLRKGGIPFWGSIILSAVMDEEGYLRGLSTVARDLTERMRTDRARSFLADVGRVLAGSLDYHTTLDRVAQLATRELAQACIIEMVEGGTIQRVAVARADGALGERVRSAARRMPEGTRLSHGVARVVQSGQSELVPEVSDAGWVGEALGLEDPNVLRDLGVQSYMCVPLTARGKTCGALVFVAAPGRRYSAEELLLAEELARRAALAIDNARLYEQAQAAIRTREEVLAIVSHDLRNPLGTIQAGVAQLLAETRDDAQRARTARIAERLRRASERMFHMIRDLLDFSSIQAGKLRIELAEHDAAELVTESIEMMQPLASEKGVRVERAVDMPGLKVRCDRERAMQVFSNLLGNAIKFTSEGGSVIVRCRREGDHVVFSVTDTGPGIAEEDRARIFDRYWQAKLKGGEGRESLGLGLAISKALIESHGGTIWAESQMNRGATSSFTLPAAT